MKFQTPAEQLAALTDSELKELYLAGRDIDNSREPFNSLVEQLYTCRARSYRFDAIYDVRQEITSRWLANVK